MDACGVDQNLAYMKSKERHQQNSTEISGHIYGKIGLIQSKQARPKVK